MACKAQVPLDRLQRIGKGRGGKRQLFLQQCSDGVIQAVCECVLNVLKGVVPITRKQKEKLARHKEELRNLIRKEIPLFKRREILVQKGNGFLSVLLPAAISHITSLIHGTR